MSIASMYNDSFTVRRRTLTEDGASGFNVSETDLSTGNAGALQGRSGSEQKAQGTEEVIITHRLYCGAITVEESDTIIVDEREFDINYINRELRGNHYQIDLIERRREEE